MISFLISIPERDLNFVKCRVIDNVRPQVYVTGGVGGAGGAYSILPILVDIAMGRFILSKVVVPLEPTSIVAGK